MDLCQAAAERHAVRQYLERPIAGDAARVLEEAAARFSAESGTHLRLVQNEPEAFSGLSSRLAGFRNVRNYFVLAGKNGRRNAETLGYYGEQLALMAQTLGLNTCWVGSTYRKRKAAKCLEPGESPVAVIAVGYGTGPGLPHRSKKATDVIRCFGDPPDWFLLGAEAALLSPTALNQQRFQFILSGERVLAATARVPFGKLDLGIAKFHFELGSSKGPEIWIG